jgi:organic radical activating enzyme
MEWRILGVLKRNKGKIIPPESHLTILQSIIPSGEIGWYALRLNLESKPIMENTCNSTAFVSEIFSSAQGEGVNIGRRQLFVRFCECHRRCLYCDTNVERTEFLRVELEPGGDQFLNEPNPVRLERLLELMVQANRPECAHDDLFITGGEPLLYADFLTRLLPEARKRIDLPVHLETSSDLPEAFAKVAPWIDHVLMDIKLPSVTGEAGTWTEHLEFLRQIIRFGAGATIKLVVNADTTPDDLDRAVAILRESGSTFPVVLQPMTATLQNDHVPTAKQVLNWQSNLAIALGQPIRIIPQTHKMMGLL